MPHCILLKQVLVNPYSTFLVWHLWSKNCDSDGFRLPRSFYDADDELFRNRAMYSVGQTETSPWHQPLGHISWFKLTVYTDIGKIDMSHDEQRPDNLLISTLCSLRQKSNEAESGKAGKNGRGERMNLTKGPKLKVSSCVNLSIHLRSSQ